MKQIILSLITFYIPLLLYCQTDTSTKGIKWTEGLTWEQVKTKAKAENNYIFLDCYATWCGPCKAMDKNVYVDGTVGQFMNEKFISIKVQMDKTNHDDSEVKKWYDDAATIQSSYAVGSFPTYLFFSPDGKPVHRAAGFKNSDQFIAVAKEVFDPAKQYYTILSNLHPDKMDTADMKTIARNFQASGNVIGEQVAANYLSRIPESELAKAENLQFMMEFSEMPQVQEIAGKYLSTIPAENLCAEMNVQIINTFKQNPRVRDIVLHYISKLNIKSLRDRDDLALLGIFKDDATAKALARRYINSLRGDEIYTKGNIQFLTNFTKRSKDKGFAIFYNHGMQVDSVMGIKGYAEKMTDYIIAIETITPYWEAALRGEEVPWEKISKMMEKKYNKQYSDRIVLRTKVIAYKNNAEQFDKNWAEYIKYNIEQIEKYGTDTTSVFWDAMLINNFTFDAIFYHSTDLKQINTAIKWMEGVMRRNPTDGNSVDTYANLLYKAGRKEEAIHWEEKALQLAPDNLSIKANLDKMKAALPTWIIQKAD